MDAGDGSTTPQAGDGASGDGRIGNTAPVVTIGDKPFEVVRVSLETGARTLVSSPDQGRGAFFTTFPLRWQTALLDQVLLVSIPEVSAVLAVDTVSGDRVVFSTSGHG